MRIFIVILLISTLLFSLPSCTKIGDEDESKGEICYSPSPLYCYNMKEFLTTLDIMQKDNASKLYLSNKHTYVPLVSSDKIKFYRVTIQDMDFVYEFVATDDTKGKILLSIYISRPEAVSKGYSEQTFKSIVSELGLPTDNGYAYSNSSNQWYVDLDDCYASITDYTNSFIKSTSDISKVITFKIYNPNYNGTRELNFNNIKKHQIYNNISDEILTITDEQRDNLFSIMNNSEWEYFTIEATPDMTISFTLAYGEYRNIEIQYFASSGLFNNITMDYHCYVSEVERIYINSLLKIEKST